MLIKDKDIKFLKQKYPLIKKVMANPGTFSPALCHLLIYADRIANDMQEIKELLSKEDKSGEKE